jgi:hypothetical protein
MARLKVSMQEASESIGQVLLPFLAQAGEWLGKLAKWIGGLDGPTKTWVVGIALVAAALGPLIGLIGTLSTALGFLAANPVVLIVLALVAFGVALYELYQNCDGFRQLVDAAWQAIQLAITAAVEALKPVFDGLVTAVKGVWQILLGIKDFIVGVFTGDWSQAWEGIKQIFSGAWQAIVGSFSAAWEWIKLVARIGWEAITVGVSAAWGWVSGVFSNVWNGIVGFFSGVWGSLVGAASGGLNWILGIVRSITDGITLAWNACWNGVGSFFSSTWNGIIDTLKNAINTVIGFLNTLIGAWNAIKIEFSTPDVPGTDWGGQDIKIDFPDMPKIPKLAAGGIVMPTAGGTSGVENSILIAFHAPIRVFKNPMTVLIAFFNVSIIPFHVEEKNDPTPFQHAFQASVMPSVIDRTIPRIQFRPPDAAPTSEPQTPEKKPTIPFHTFENTPLTQPQAADTPTVIASQPMRATSLIHSHAAENDPTMACQAPEKICLIPSHACDQSPVNTPTMKSLMPSKICHTPLTAVTRPSKTGLSASTAAVIANWIACHAASTSCLNPSQF